MNKILREVSQELEIEKNQNKNVTRRNVMAS